MKRLMLFILMLFGLLMGSEASNETYSKCLRGSDIRYNAQLAINSQHYNRTNWNVSNPFVRVRLYLAEDRYVTHSNNEDFSVIYDITLTGDNIPSITLTDTLNVGYRQNSPYRDLDINEYQNYKAASLRITSDPTNITEDIVFELQLCYPRFTKTDSVGTPFDLRRKYLENTNELLLTWGYLDGADVSIILSSDYGVSPLHRTASSLIPITFAAMTLLVWRTASRGNTLQCMRRMVSARR